MSLPAYLQNLPSRNLAQTAISNVGQGNPPYLSIEGNRFTLGRRSRQHNPNPNAAYRRCDCRR